MRLCDERLGLFFSGRNLALIFSRTVKRWSGAGVAQDVVMAWGNWLLSLMCM